MNWAIKEIANKNSRATPWPRLQSSVQTRTAVGCLDFSKEQQHGLILGMLYPCALSQSSQTVGNELWKICRWKGLKMTWSWHRDEKKGEQKWKEIFCFLFVGCLTSQQHASVSQGRICSDNFMCCHTEIEVADQTVHLTQSQYTDTRPTSPSADPMMPGAWQGSHWSTNFLSHWYDSTPEKSRCKWDSDPGPSALQADALTTRPMRQSKGEGNPYPN